MVLHYGNFAIIQKRDKNSTSAASHMPLKLRPTGLGSGIDKDRHDYAVYCGEWGVGRIYQTRVGPDSLRWFWSLTVNGLMTRADCVATLEKAKTQFQKSRDAWKARAKLEATRELLRVKLAVHLALVLEPIVTPATSNCLGLFPSAAHPYNRGVFTFVGNTGIVNLSGPLISSSTSANCELNALVNHG
jgi:hypothetical protein